MDLERYIREFFESTKFSKWCLKEAKAYVLAKDSDMNYSPEEFLEIFQRELRLKSNNCNLYKAAKDKAINLLQSMNSDTDDQEMITNEHQSNLDGSIYRHDFGQNFSEFLEQGIFSDVLIEVQKQTFKAHSLVICSRSTFFAKTLSPENLSFSKITIPDITAKSFEIILKYLYSGLLSLEGLRPSEIFDLYYAALKLEIRDIGTFILSIVHFE
ncbi:BTB/POZ protein [Gigaspora rosea]|uniref:BTB/POZ protein n=1 Tax=Gigaspora rosea TaxID=44941 RepID=A0A397U9V9_9GLOM|nr:BTB/POZ protein [Gigaspora rosea]